MISSANNNWCSGKTALAGALISGRDLIELGIESRPRWGNYWMQCETNNQPKFSTREEALRGLRKRLTFDRHWVRYPRTDG